VGKVKDSGHFQLRVESDEAGDPNARDVAEFVMLLHAIYLAGLTYYRSHRPQASQDEGLPTDLLAGLARMNAAQLMKLFRREPISRDSLRMSRMSHSSPLEIDLTGVAIVIAWAVAICGGRLEVSKEGLRAELPGLVQTIERLHRLLTRRTGTTIGYGVRERRVKLTRAELNELMRHDPSTRDRGGFQRFLISLQDRVDLKTRELTLSANDIDTVLKHGAQPQKGGWQRSIRRVFDSHFDWSGPSSTHRE
jgi:hypothetical protein